MSPCNKCGGTGLLETCYKKCGLFLNNKCPYPNEDCESECYKTNCTIPCTCDKGNVYYEGYYGDDIPTIRDLNGNLGDKSIIS